MRRLPVRLGYRGKQIGAALLERLGSDARQIGYRQARLDTFPLMDSALRLYERYGFHGILRYNDNPASSVVFIQLDL